MKFIVDLVLWVILLAVYFVPMMVANYRRKKNINAITVLNVLLGWTVLGWVMALIWAFLED